MAAKNEQEQSDKDEAMTFKEGGKKTLVQGGKLVLGAFVIVGLAGLAQLYIQIMGQRREQQDSEEPISLKQLVGMLPRESMAIIDMLSKETDNRRSLINDMICQEISQVKRENISAEEEGREKGIQLKVDTVLKQLDDDETTANKNKSIVDQDSPYMRKIGSRDLDAKEARKVLSKTINRPDRTASSAVVKFLFVDDCIAACVGSTSFHPIFESLQNEVSPGISQVITFGGLVDFRPWRLDIPHTVSLYDLDSLSGQKVKIGILKKINAQLQMGKELKGQKYPLKCNYNPTVYDKSNKDWIKRIQNMGFEADKPSIFVAQNLLQTLEGNEITKYFEAVNQVAAKNSVMFCNAPSQENIIRLHEETKQHIDYQSQDIILKNFKWGYPSSREKFFGDMGWAIYIVIGQQSAARLYCSGIDKYNFYDLHEQDYLVLKKI